VVSIGFLRRHPRWRTVLFGIIPYGVSLGCLIWVLTGINWHELWQELSHAEVHWIIIAAGIEAASDVFHGWRWNLLLQPVSNVRLWRTVRALFVGLFANEILPLRPGEFIRSYLVAGWVRIRFSVVISSVALERLLDGFSLVVGFSITTLFLSPPSHLVAGVRVMAGVLVSASFGLMLLLWRVRHRAVLPRWMRRFLPAIEGIRQMANLRTLTLCSAASFLQLGFQGSSYWALSRSARLDLSIWALIAVLIVVRIATSVPSAPGNLGLLQMACVLALGLFGIDKTLATGFAALLFLVFTVPLLIGGATVLAFTGVSLRELRRSVSHEAMAPSQGSQSSPTSEQCRK
jgi:uncharacterized membrane protein YbhN (UPF0104 family)